MRVLYIDQYFSTHDGFSGTRSFDLASRLVGMGHEVTMLTSPNSYWMPQGTGGGLIRRREVNGIDVVILGVGYSQKMGLARRGLSFGLFAAAASLVGPFLARPDVVFATSTPLTVGIPGALIAATRGCPMIFEVRDLWPEAPARLGILHDGILLGCLRRLERWIYARSAAVVALSPGMAEGVLRAGVFGRAISAIPNVCNTDLFSAEPEVGLAKELGVEGRKVLLYAGAMGPTNGLDALIDLAIEAGRRDPGVVFLLAGDGPCRPRLRERIEREGLANVVLIDPLPRSKMPGLFNISSLTLTMFADNPVLEMNSPNKFFDSLAAGKPTLVNRPGWTAEMVEDAGAGLRLPTEDPAAAAEVLIDLLSDEARLRSMGEAARRLARGELNVDNAARKLASILDAAARSSLRRPVQAALKNVMDRLAAFIGLAVLSPLFLAIALAVKIDSPGVVMFRLRRAGRHGFIFRPFKFRTMAHDAWRSGPGLNIGEEDERITGVGRFLRRWSLDELPQLIDVLLGRMSLVGPRPMLPEQAAKLDWRGRRRLAVRPGITGWAQVNGRNKLTWGERIELDLQYIERWSLLLDLRILLRTIFVALRGEGLYEGEGASSDPFNEFGRDDG